MARLDPPTSFDTFDPNGADFTIWAAWDGREFYTRKNRSGVITRFGNCAFAKLYELTPDGWHCHAVKDVSKENDTCQMCSLVGVQEAWEDKRAQSWRAYFVPNDAYRWERKGGNITKPPKLWFLCPGCVNRTGW